MNINYKIPKVIHYCWFGKKEKPQFIRKCMDSWKRYLPDYEIIEWNEGNFNININKFIKEAYEAGKFAFVSDYVRVFVLYNYGGIYLDTDVEVLKPLDCFLHHSSFWGFEERNFIATSSIGAIQGNVLIKRLLNSYEGKSFLLPDGSYNTLTNVSMVTKLFDELGLLRNGQYQEFDNLAVVYPQVYFSPYDYINCRIRVTDSSYTIHHFYKSWVPLKDRILANFKNILAKIIGGQNIARLRELINKLVPNRSVK